MRNEKCSRLQVAANQPNLQAMHPVLYNGNETGPNPGPTLLQQKLCCSLAEGACCAQLRLHPVPGLPALQVVGEGPPLAHVLHKQHKVPPILGPKEMLVHAQERERGHGVARGPVQLQPRLPHNLHKRRQGGGEKGQRAERLSKAAWDSHTPTPRVPGGAAHGRKDQARVAPTGLNVSSPQQLLLPTTPGVP